ncbi:RWD domain-containing protein 1 [Eurytemora carolleeae]|uniref:RWD domain-containing protein 1 n=1 Tax=Eurytemora carolleeae TaxID=1294199 RepID=UPI000C78D4D7|nr:RWD domain-containing protein 1 [Eurytemora carolleeae]|eukprot:XP_023334173.1 RWD domain-containing protein 1-like [Eurytemora affinis]
MVDYAQEQQEELEAIESIYSEEIDIIGDGPHRFTIPVKTEEYNEDEGEGRYVLLKFTFTPKYPSEAPLVEFEETENIDDVHLDELHKHLEEQIEENLGMQMVFTIVSAALEWLCEKNDQIKHDMEEAARKKKEKEEEEERKKLEGTKVTIESFLAWKAEFDRERLEKKGVKVLTGKEKLTGRELFMSDTTLNDSDIKFLAAAGDTAITVDESLFEELDDLDIDDDEESDDPDWNPGKNDDSD